MPQRHARCCNVTGKIFLGCTERGKRPVVYMGILGQFSPKLGVGNVDEKYGEHIAEAASTSRML